MSQATKGSMQSSPRSQSRADQLLRRPSAVPPPEGGGGAAAAAAPGRSAMLLRRSGSELSDTSLTLDNKNPSKLVVKPDGNILWEMPNDPAGPPAVGGLARSAAELALVLSAASSGVMGIAVAVVELKRAAEEDYCVTSQHLAKLMAMTVSSSFAGTVAGLVYAPLLAARMVCGRFARPAALAGAVWAATRGALRLLALRGLGPAALLSQLEEAALSLGAGCLAAADNVARRAAASPRFRRAFVRMGGVDALLRLLRNGLDADAVRAVLGALRELLADPGARADVVAGGGVPLLVNGLGHPDEDVTRCCSEMLARLAAEPGAHEAMRASGGLPDMVELLATSPSEQQQLHLLAVLTDLAAGSPACSRELCGSGLGAAVLALVGPSPRPRTQLKEAALASLHRLASTGAEHLDALRAAPGACDQLRGVAAAYAGCWYGSKPALGALLAQLAAAEEAAAAAAPIAGEAPEMVELPHGA